MLDYLPIILAFAAAILAIGGEKKTNPAGRGWRRLTKSGWAALMLAVVALLTGVATTRRSHNMQAFMKNTARTRSLPKATGFPLTVKLGSNVSYVFEPGKVPEIEFPPTFTVEVSKELAILVSGEVRQRDGRVIGQIQQSNLSINLGDKYDVNSDLNGFEVVDARSEPIIQAELKEDGALLVVNLVTYVMEPDGKTYLYVATEFGTVPGSPGGKKEPSGILSKMFRYPGSEFQGVRSPENMRARQAEMAADREGKAKYASSISELRQLDSTSLADSMINIATEIADLENSREFSWDPMQRDREADKVLNLYKDNLESRALAARDTALARLGPDAPANHLPEYGYKSTNRTALMSVPIDLGLLAAALKRGAVN